MGRRFTWNKIGDHPEIVQLTQNGYTGCNACKQMNRHHGRYEGMAVCPGTEFEEGDEGKLARVPKDG